MADRIYYHHPENSQYSLAYVTRERNEISASGNDVIIEQYDLDEEFFVLYTNHGASGTVDELDQDFEDVLDEMSPDDRIIAVRLLQIFEVVIEEQQLEEGQKLEIYKEIELERIPDAIGHVDWSLAAVDVAGQLMSTLLLKHALPNANHRTSIALSKWYLESSKSAFSFPVLATEDFNWKDWVDEYITKSKRMLTVRRNTTAFSLLQEWGCDTVERKGGTVIDLDEYCLEYSRSEALQKYAERHTALCTEFMVESVKRAGYEGLIGSDGTTKPDFVAYLRNAA